MVFWCDLDDLLTRCDEASGMEPGVKRVLMTSAVVEDEDLGAGLC